MNYLTSRRKNTPQTNELFNPKPRVQADHQVQGGTEFAIKCTKGNVCDREGKGKTREVTSYAAFFSLPASSCWIPRNC